ncbi:unnamed protein product [Cuscuta campestris]|uniref:Reverse transcriptase domain-containing protein n=1 Tax=Cuscuta campestris TaxID=132261 RepID=A0A484M279_9ASTE|nr:unnamed protein product [Cuscuta campestris]
MVVTKWTPDYIEGEDCPIVPVWVSCPKLPIYLHDQRALSLIGSSIGRPLKVDENTLNFSRPDLARFCVEVDVSRALPSKVHLKLGDKDSFISLIYENVPHYCTECKKLGHHKGSCKRDEQRKIVQEKESNSAPKPPNHSYKGKEPAKEEWTKVTARNGGVNKVWKRKMGPFQSGPGECSNTAPVEQNKQLQDKLHTAGTDPVPLHPQNTKDKDREGKNLALVLWKPLPTIEESIFTPLHLLDNDDSDSDDSEYEDLGVVSDLHWKDEAPLQTAKVEQKTIDQSIKSRLRGMRGLANKLKALKKIIQDWNHTTFGNIFSKVKEAETEALKAQEIFEREDTPANREASNLANANLLKICKQEESYWAQKSNIKWLAEGDISTKFFHSFVKGKRRKASIRFMKNQEGKEMVDHVELSTYIAKHFENTFTEEHSGNLDPIIQHIPTLITEHDNQAILQLPIEEEIKSAIWHLNPNSSAGPDGFNGEFFRYFWDTIKMDMVSAVQEFFLGIPLPMAFGSSLITLIPKTEGAKEIGDYRPIALSTFFSKIISRILSSRLAPLLDKIISPEQAGFLKGRGIEEHILLSNEYMHNLDSKTRGGNVMIKLDMAKAFDKMSWNYLEAILKAFGFNENCTALLLQNLKSTYMSILVNGRPAGFFKIKRGVKQGDPLSPLLFIIGSEGFSRSLKHAISSGFLSPYKAGRSQVVSHLAYADDLIVFLRGDIRNMLRFKYTLYTYLQASVQDLSLSVINLIHSKLANFFWGSKFGKNKHHWAKWVSLCRPTGEGGLGIRSLFDIQRDSALKLWWKAITGDTIWAQFVKNKYYRDGLFEAKVYDSASWKRICRIAPLGFQHSNMQDNDITWVNGTFTFKEAYWAVRERDISTQFNTLSWNKFQIPKGGRGGFAMKGRGKRKFFKCLESSGVHGGGRKSKRSSLAGKEMTEDGEKCKSSIDSDTAFDFANNDRPTEKSRRSFSRTIKAALFETSLSRKFRRKGPSIPIAESKDVDLSQKEKMKKLPLDDSKQCWGTDENLGSHSSDMWDSSLLHSSLSFTTTTTLSFSRASSWSASERKISEVNEEMAPTTSAAKAALPALKPPRPPAAMATVMKEPIVPIHMPMARYCNLRIICFVILSLMALIFWGKVLAIVCTSIWLYLIPRFTSSPEVEEGLREGLRKSIFSNRLA